MQNKLIGFSILLFLRFITKLSNILMFLISFVILIFGSKKHTNEIKYSEITCYLSPEKKNKEK